MNKEITTVIFDWAGVFCSPGEPFSHPDITSETGLTLDEMGSKTKNLQELYYKGKIKTQEFWKRVIDEFGIKKATAEDLGKAYISSYTIYPEMLELAEKLKQNYKTAILSNLTEEMMEHVINTHQLEKKFTCLFFSNQMGLMKPDKEAYEYALKKIGSEPQETVFIDDSPKNVEAAKNLSINAFVFESAEQCKKELEKLGVVY